MRFAKRGGAFSWIAVAAVACLAFASSGAAAEAASPAEAFVQTNVQRGMEILNNKTLPQDQMRSQFRDFLTSLTDINRIAMFTLGPVKRTASDADKAAFTAAFKDYAVAVYDSRLSQYTGQTLKVTGSTAVKPGDWVVNCVMVDPKAKSGSEPVQVDFRVLQDNGKFVVVDASVVGVWLGIEERDQFTAFLAQNNNDIKKLIDHLNTLTAALKNGGGKKPT